MGHETYWDESDYKRFWPEISHAAPIAYALLAVIVKMFSLTLCVVVVPYIYNITFAFPHGVITLADVIQGRKIHVDVSLKSGSYSHDIVSLTLMCCKGEYLFLMYLWNRRRQQVHG